MALWADMLVEGDDSAGLHEVDQLCLGVGEAVVGGNLKYRVYKHPGLILGQLLLILSDHRQELWDQVWTEGRQQKIIMTQVSENMPWV